MRKLRKDLLGQLAQDKFVHITSLPYIVSQNRGNTTSSRVSAERKYRGTCWREDRFRHLRTVIITTSGQIWISALARVSNNLVKQLCPKGRHNYRRSKFVYGGPVLLEGDGRLPFQSILMRVADPYCVI